MYELIFMLSFNRLGVSGDDCLKIDYLLQPKQEQQKMNKLSTIRAEPAIICLMHFVASYLNKYYFN